MQLADYLVEKKSSVIDAMQKIDYNTKGIVYVCEKGVLCGSVTDGDVRRHILNHIRPKVLSDVMIRDMQNMCILAIR